MLRMINRSISFFEDADSEIAEWLEGHPDVSRASDLETGRIPDLLSARISNRQRIRVNLTTPCSQQIGFEAHVHFLGQTDLAMMALVVILIIRKKRMLFLSPYPKLFRFG